MISSQIRMRRFENGTRDPKMIAAILDQISIVHVGCFDEEYPYVVPLSFGYEIKDDKLFVYLHGAREGHKVDLWEKNPHVALTFSTFYNHTDKLYRGCMHDYRSVMALGTIARVDRKEQCALHGTAVQTMLKHNNRKPTEFSVPHYMWMGMYVVTCDMKNVVGKFDNPVETPAEVPFEDVYAVPENNTPYDYAYFYHRKSYKSVSGKWVQTDFSLKSTAGDEFTLPRSEKLAFRAEWAAVNQNEYTDFDLSALLLNNEGKVCRRYDMVFYNQPGNMNDSITLSGDDALSAAKGREEISVDFDAVPDNVSAIVLQLSAYGDKTGNIDSLRGINLSVLDGKGRELIGYGFKTEDCVCPAVSLAAIKREGDSWRVSRDFRPLSSWKILDRAYDLGLIDWEE